MTLRHGKAGYHWLLPFFVLFLAFAIRCSDSQSPQQEPAEPATVPASESLPPLKIPKHDSPQKTGLLKADEQPIPGFVLPERLKLEHRQGMNRTYSTHLGVEPLIAFYQGHGYVVERNPAGATVRSLEHQGLLTVVRTGHKQTRLIFIIEPKASDAPDQMPETIPVGEPARQMHESVKKAIESGSGSIKEHLPEDFPQ